MEPTCPSGAPRILVVKLSSLGDLFHALPLVHRLKTATGATIDWVTQTEYVELVRCFEDVDRVIAFPRRSTLRELPGFLRELRSTSYQRVLDLQGLMKSALVARAARAGERIGPSFHREGAAGLYTRVAGRRNKQRHAVDEILDFADLLGLARQPIRFPVRFPNYPVEQGRPRVALIPCSRWATKNWPPERFSGVARALQERAGASIVLVGGPEDASACAAMASAVPGVRNLAGCTRLVELGGLLAAMDLVVTVDTGPMHMAAAVDTPVLALFGATDPLRTGPYGPRHRVLSVSGLDCRPCRSRTCARGDLACLERLAIEDVVTAALEMLAAVRSKG